MTDKEKQIEEMAQAIFDYVDTKNMRFVYIRGNKTIDEAKPFLHNTGVAKFMYEKGYRKQSDTVREFVYKVLQIGSKRPLCLFDEYKEGYIDCIDQIKELAAQYGVEVEE